MSASQGQVASGNILAASAKLRKKHPSPRGTEVSMKQAAMKMSSGSSQQLQHMHANQQQQNFMDKYQMKTRNKLSG